MREGEGISFQPYPVTLSLPALSSRYSGPAWSHSPAVASLPPPLPVRAPFTDPCIQTHLTPPAQGVRAGDIFWDISVNKGPDPLPSVNWSTIFATVHVDMTKHTCTQTCAYTYTHTHNFLKHMVRGNLVWKVELRLNKGSFKKL